MKIGILIDRLNVGGVEKIAIEQVKSLNLLGIEASLLVLCEKAVVKDAFKDLLIGTPVVFLDRRMPKPLKVSFKFPVFHFFSLFHITYPFLLPFFMKKKEYDFIIPHGTFTTFSAIGFKLHNKIRFAPFIWDPIGYILNRVYFKSFPKIIFIFLMKLAQYLDKLVVNFADFVFVGGTPHNDYIRKLKKGINIVVVPPSVHPSVKLATKKNDFVLMATAWKNGKNPEYIFEIVKCLPKIKIKMVGKWLDHKYYSDFLDKVKDSGYENNIEVVGEVNETELKKYYLEALVFLQTNDDRGFGMPALEAASNGTTFIIPKDQGVCALFTNEIDGFFTKEFDTKKISSILAKLLSNREMAIKMGKLAHKKVIENYSWKKHSADIIGAILKKHSSNRISN